MRLPQQAVTKSQHETPLRHPLPLLVHPLGLPVSPSGLIVERPLIDTPGSRVFWCRTWGSCASDDIIRNREVLSHLHSDSGCRSRF